MNAFLPMKTVLSLAALFTVLCGQAVAAESVQNVLFIISDDLRANVLGCYGDKVCATPNKIILDS